MSETSPDRTATAEMHLVQEVFRTNWARLSARGGPGAKPKAPEAPDALVLPTARSESSAARGDLEQ